MSYTTDANDDGVNDIMNDDIDDGATENGVNPTAASDEQVAYDVPKDEYVVREVEDIVACTKTDDAGSNRPDAEANSSGAEISSPRDNRRGSDESLTSELWPEESGCRSFDSLIRFLAVSAQTVASSLNSDELCDRMEITNPESRKLMDQLVAETRARLFDRIAEQVARISKEHGVLQGLQRFEAVSRMIKDPSLPRDESDTAEYAPDRLPETLQRNIEYHEWTRRIDHYRSLAATLEARIKLRAQKQTELRAQIAEQNKRLELYLSPM